jgi:hypothetical protein
MNMKPNCRENTASGRCIIDQTTVGGEQHEFVTSGPIELRVASERPELRFTILRQR